LMRDEQGNVNLQGFDTRPFQSRRLRLIEDAGAARNSSGTWSNPSSPFITGTAINSATVNALIADLGAEITDSASRSGKGGFTAPVRAADGTVAAPAFSFTSDTDTGIYRIGSNDVAMSAGNTKIQEWIATGSTVTGT